MLKQRPIFLPTISRDIQDILHWSEEHFGVAAAERYGELIRQALHDVQVNPFRLGAMARPGLAPDAYVYHLAYSRDHVTGAKVKVPRHFVLYRFTGTAIEFARLLHDSCDLVQHLPEAYR